MPEEHKEEHAHHHSESNSALSGLTKKFWMISTVVASVLAIVLLVIVLSGVGSGVGEKKAADNLVSFVAAQGGNLEILSTTKEGGLYKIAYSYNGQQSEVYMTLDGKNIVPSTIPVSGDVSGGNQAQDQPTPKDVVKSDKPNVELFIMSYCPYGTQTQKGILPVASLLKDKIDFKVRWVDYAMHGKKEIDENTVQYCIEKEQNSKYLKYIQCFLGEGNSSMCLANASVDKTKLNSCIAAADTEFSITKNFDDKSSWMSGQFPQYNVDKADNEKYGVQGSPTLVINGQQVDSGRSPAALLATICSAFNNEPDECKQTLSTASPSAGFGYSTSADAAAAQCGV